MLTVFLHATESILTIILMFMTGWFMTRLGWLDNSCIDIFSKIILNVSLPCYMLWNILTTFDRPKLVKLSGGLLIPFLSIGLTYLLGIFISNIMKVKKGRKGIFRSVFFNSNTIFVGLAVNLALFGEQSMPYVLLYYIANTTFFWTLGIYEISKDGENPGASSSFSIKSSLKHILSPALGGFIVAIILVLLGVHLPTFIMDSSKYIGGLTTPLAMLFIGVVLYSIRLKDIRLDRDIIMLILARFVICPLVVILLEHFIHLPPLMAKVFVIQSAMPAMTSTGVVAKSYGADYEFGTIVTAITTVLSMIAIPIYMVLL